MSQPLPDWASGEIDLSKPSAARMYDYYLGGAHNFDIDRELARKVLDLFPDAPLAAQANRAFMHRALRCLLAAGVRQFIDLGSGIPTEGNTHETVHQKAPDSKVLYVDHDQVAVIHSELLLKDVPNTQVLQADFRDPEYILNSPQLKKMIDLSQPVGLLLVSVLHFVPDRDQPQDVLHRLYDALAPGSYLILSHGCDDVRQDEMHGVAEAYAAAADQLSQRSRAQILELLAGWDLLEPGLVWLREWRPDWPDEVGENPSANAMVAAVGRKP